MLSEFRLGNETAWSRGLLTAVACLAALQLTLTGIVLHRVAQSAPPTHVVAPAQVAPPSVESQIDRPVPSFPNLSPPAHSPLVLDCAGVSDSPAKSKESPWIGPVGGATSSSTRLTCWDVPVVGSGSGR